MWDWLCRRYGWVQQTVWNAKDSIATRSCFCGRGEFYNGDPAVSHFRLPDFQSLIRLLICLCVTYRLCVSHNCLLWNQTISKLCYLLKSPSPDGSILMTSRRWFFILFPLGWLVWILTSQTLSHCTRKSQSDHSLWCMHLVCRLGWFVRSVYLLFISIAIANSSLDSLWDNVPDGVAEQDLDQVLAIHWPGECWCWCYFVCKPTIYVWWYGCIVGMKQWLKL